MTTTVASSWFIADKEGLGEQTARRSPAFAIYELFQNAADEAVTRVEINLSPSGMRGLAFIQCVDDSPLGFEDLADTFTLFKRSKKADDPTRRGRFNSGEKYVLSRCASARIESTKGTVVFKEDGTREVSTRERIPVGSVFTANITMTQDAVRQALREARQIIVPDGITFILNGEEVEHREPFEWFEAKGLQTEVDFRPTRRNTRINLYEPLDGETPTIYEMGIPVVEHDGPYHIDVCVAPDTRLLTADLRYIPADTVQVGMELLGFDEEQEGFRRRFRTSEVKEVRRVLRPSYRLTFDDGTSVVCSADHQWLTRWSNTIRWLSTERMRPTIGDKPGSRVVRLLDVWDEPDTAAAGYLAAAYDGEGCLLQRDLDRPTGGGVSNQLVFVQNDNVMLHKVVGLLRSEGFDPVVTERSSSAEHPEWKSTFSVRLRSRQEMLRFLGTYRPGRLLPKLAPDLLGSLPYSRTARLVRKDYLGEVEVIAIETSTHTFIAEGLASHNCQCVPLNSDRDNVTPAYLRALHALVLEHTALRLTADEAGSGWVKDAINEVAPEVARDVFVRRFGEKTVIADPSDREATKRLMDKGYTILSGRSLTSDEWAAAKRAEVFQPAGRVLPSGIGSTPDGVPPVPEDQWTTGMRRIAVYAEGLGKELLGFTPRVKFYKMPFGQAWDGCWGGGCVSFNMTSLGAAWFDNPTRTMVDELLIHEFAHHKASDHLSDKFHRECTRLGALLRDCKTDL